MGGLPLFLFGFRNTKGMFATVGHISTENIANTEGEREWLRKTARLAGVPDTSRSLSIRMVRPRA